MTGSAGTMLRVVRGEPDAEELAALVAVLAARSPGAAAGPGVGPGDGEPQHRSRWAARSELVRRPLAPGPGAWRASGWPR